MLIQLTPGENTSNIPSAIMAAFNYTAQLGGTLVVSGGTASGTIVSSGGSISVNTGTVIDTTLYSGGGQNVGGTGVASGTIVSSGGAETVGDPGPGTHGIQGTTVATV